MCSSSFAAITGQEGRQAACDRGYKSWCAIPRRDLETVDPSIYDDDGDDDDSSVHCKSSDHVPSKLALIFSLHSRCQTLYALYEPPMLNVFKKLCTIRILSAVKNRFC